METAISIIGGLITLIGIAYPVYSKIKGLNEKANKLTDKFNSTGIVQPPIHSSACFKIYESNMNKFRKKLTYHLILYQNVILPHGFCLCTYLCSLTCHLQQIRP